MLWYPTQYSQYEIPSSKILYDIPFIVLLLIFSWYFFINHLIGLTSPDMSHKPRVPKFNRQEPGGSTSGPITLFPKETCSKSNHKEPVGSTYERLTLLLNKIRHISTQNKILAPSINNRHKTDIPQRCNSLHRKCVDIIQKIRSAGLD